MAISPVPEDKLLKLIKSNKPRVCGKPKFTFRVFLSLGFLNNFLALIFILLSVFLAVSAFNLFFYPQPAIDMAVFSSSGSNDWVGKVEVKPFSYYQDLLSARNIFISGPPIKAVEPFKRPVNEASDTFEDLSLIGIVSGELPKAIVYDKKTDRTYYLKEGESFRNAKVEKIGSGKAIFGFGDNKIELVL